MRARMGLPRLLILQGQLAEYRRPVFNRLADHYTVTVAHAGRAMAREGDRFRELILPVRRFGPFHLHRRGAIPGLMAEADATVAMFDLGWPAYVLPAFTPNRHGRFILWGHRYGARPIANRLREVVMKRADALLMYGTEHHAQMIAAGVDPARIFVAPNTMDVPNHQDYAAATKHSILFVGRLQARKRLDLALDSFAAILAQIPPDIHFDIVGAGEPEAALRAQAAALGIADRVRFHGAITDDAALAQLFATAIAYVSPGPVGLSVLHSFAYGVPVITLRDGYHGPEFHNLAHGDNGLIVERDADFAPALQRLITDPALAARLGAAAYRRYAGERTIDHMIDGFKKAIDGAGESGHGRR
jgi:glycosyltransferase involved in cell wall biosynthesis